MHQLTIHKLGPIQDCQLPIRQYTVLTGYQASGKSTIAKAVYFFRSLQEDLFQRILRRGMLGYVSGGDSRPARTLTGEFESCVRNKFLSTFGTSYCMDQGMRLHYRYGEGVEVTIRLKRSDAYLTPNFVWVEYTQPIRAFLQSHEGVQDQRTLRKELAELFQDPFETVYIPAGRSVLTVLGSQFNYFYSTMDDTQKRLLDTCTRDYLERVMKLRPQFADGVEGLLAGRRMTAEQQDLYQQALARISQILKGRYTAVDGEERIWVDKERYVKINFASSGQQEIVWILNLLFYYLIQQRPVFFLVEEPESHLFPASQKAVVELLALVANAGHGVLMTTHSPYVLGAVNNLLYAGTVGREHGPEAGQIVPPGEWIDSSACEARFVEKGGAEDCMDRELMQIDNARLDQISRSINEEYDALFAVEERGMGPCR